MRKFLILFSLISSSAFAVVPDGYCEVIVCNRLERFSLNPFKHMQDSMGEVCTPSIIDKQSAVVGKVLDSNSRWYQGSFNPTKKSVTRVKSVGACGK